MVTVTYSQLCRDTSVFEAASFRGRRMSLDRYYTDEHLAPAAERAYWQHSRRQAHEAHITVRVREGLAVLEELYIAGKPLREFLQQEAEQR
jgi:hypothetical protein